jgi:hypothetical protein
MREFSGRGWRASHVSVRVCGGRLPRGEWGGAWGRGLLERSILRLTNVRAGELSISTLSAEVVKGRARGSTAATSTVPSSVARLKPPWLNPSVQSQPTRDTHQPVAHTKLFVAALLVWGKACRRQQPRTAAAAATASCSSRRRCCPATQRTLRVASTRSGASRGPSLQRATRYGSTATLGPSGCPGLLLSACCRDLAGAPRLAGVAQQGKQQLPGPATRAVHICMPRRVCRLSAGTSAQVLLHAALRGLLPKLSFAQPECVTWLEEGVHQHVLLLPEDEQGPLQQATARRLESYVCGLTQTSCSWVIADADESQKALQADEVAEADVSCCRVAAADVSCWRLRLRAARALRDSPKQPSEATTMLILGALCPPGRPDRCRLQAASPPRSSKPCSRRRRPPGAWRWCRRVRAAWAGGLSRLPHLPLQLPRTKRRVRGRAAHLHGTAASAYARLAAS